jgi:CRP-like cAMP-binding protein
MVSKALKQPPGNEVCVDYLQALSRSIIFTHYSEDQIRNLIALGVTRKFSAGEWIVYQGDVWPYLFFVASGEVIAVKESLEGRRLILETIGEQEIFWGLAFFLEDEPMPASLRADQACSLILWSQERLSPWVLRDGKLSWELSRLALRRVLRASSIVDDLAFQPVAGRLAKLLVERFGERQQERVNRNMTLEEMAAHIGTTREVVCRILQRFANQGLIDITRTEFVFTDRDGLAQLAQKTGE